jgi:hypothetical protein
MTKRERLLAKLHQITTNANGWGWKERDALCEIVRELIEGAYEGERAGRDIARV